MKEFTYSVQKRSFFFFNEEVYKQTDGIAIGSPLGSVFADIFKAELENTIAPILRKYLSFWKRCANDTICFVNIGTIDYIITILNNFNPNITFTSEVEKDCKLPF